MRQSRLTAALEKATTAKQFRFGLQTRHAGKIRLSESAPDPPTARAYWPRCQGTTGATLSDFELRHYLVAIVDVLGQRAQLRELRQLPTSPIEEDAVLQTLRQTAGFVLALRKAFRELIEGYSEPTHLLLELPEAQRAELLELRRSEILVRGVSDSIVVSVPVRDDNDFCNSLNGVFGTLFGIAGMFLTSLAMGKAVRGGVDVGLALEISPGEIYGAALERAYKLEASVASSPRIVIGDELRRFLHAATTMPVASHGSRIAKEVASLCLHLIAQDVDGQHILDYMGKTFQQQVPADTANSLTRPAYEFAVREERRLSDGECDAVHRKYVDLRKYMESRLHFWGIQQVVDKDDVA